MAGEFRAQPLLRVEQLAKALALDELHDDRLAAVLFEHVVHRDDVRMVEAGGGDRLAPEPLGHDGSEASVGLSHLTATLRSSVRSTASHTSAMPPCAS